MDTRVLEAQGPGPGTGAPGGERQLTATSLVAQRESGKSAAQAVVAQRQAELTATQKRFTRTEALVQRNALCNNSSTTMGDPAERPGGVVRGAARK